MTTYHIYILYSKSLNRFYVGQTTKLQNKILEHNNGESPYTSQGIPWTLLWSTTKPSCRQAESLEFKLKNLSQIRKIRLMKKYSDGIEHHELLLKIESHLK